jgi:hypothetical protein
VERLARGRRLGPDARCGNELLRNTSIGRRVKMDTVALAALLPGTAGESQVRRDSTVARSSITREAGCDRQDERPEQDTEHKRPTASFANSLPHGRVRA